MINHVITKAEMDAMIEAYHTETFAVIDSGYFDASQINLSGATKIYIAKGVDNGVETFILYGTNNAGSIVTPIYERIFGNPL